MTPAKRVAKIVKSSHFFVSLLFKLQEQRGAPFVPGKLATVLRRGIYLEEQLQT